MTLRGAIKALTAIAIIGAGAAIGWAVATNTNPYAPGQATTAPVAAANATVTRPTPLPTFTPTTATSPAAAGAAPARGGQTGAAGQGQPAGQTTRAAGQTTTAAGQAGAAGQGQRARAVSGTIEDYDAATKTLTLKEADGKSVKYATTNTRVTKSEKLTEDAFSKLLSPTSIVQLTGDKGSDGTYAARSLTAIDTTGFAQGAPGGGGQGQAAPGGGFGGQGANAPVIVRGGSLDGKKFSGASFTGDTITANLTDSTSLLNQSAAALEDLKPGLNVSITARQAQGDAPAEAVTITIS